MFYSGRLNVEAKLYQLIDANYDGEDPNNEYIEITEAYEFTKLVPGQVFSFKIEMTNAGTIPGYLKLEMALNSLSNSDVFQHLLIEYNYPEENLVSQNIDYNMLFFQNKYLNPGLANTYTFYFNIKVKPELGNNFKSLDLVIDKFIVTLDQVETT
ncbi:hypothetical protein [Acholeplasma hippikon]|nr:hypothetical protein [Acholeplasma hippikon]